MMALCVAAFALWMQAAVLRLGEVPLLAIAVAASLGTLRILLPFNLPTKKPARCALVLGVCVVAVACVATTAIEVDHPGRVFPVALTLRVSLLLLFLQSAIIVSQPQYGIIPGAVPCLGFAALVCAANQTLRPTQEPDILLFSTLCVISLAKLFQYGSGVRKRRTGSSVAYRWLIQMAVLVLTVCGAWACSNFWTEGVNRVQAMMMDLDVRSDRSRIGNSPYVRSGSLRSVTLAKQNDPMNVALRVYASGPPGYLRGRVFDTYWGAEWKLSMWDDGRGSRRFNKQLTYPAADTPTQIDRPASGRNLFPVEATETGSFRRIEVHNDPKRGKMYFTPLGTDFIDGVGAYLAMDGHRVLHTGIDSRKPYVTYVCRDATRERLTSYERQLLSSPPYQLHPGIKQKAAQLCRTATTSRAKINAITTFFRENFQYSAEGLDAPDDVEPVSYFILNRKPAHCELFATGTVFMLRSQGVACRYVTGYVATELEGEYGDYWLARNRNAHAWVEAFDDDLGQWVTVEPTPGMEVPEFDSGAAADGDAARAANGRAGDATRSAAEWWNWLTSGSWGEVGLFLKLTVVSVLIWLAVRLGRERLTQRKKHFGAMKSAAATNQASHMHKLIARLDRQLKKRNFVRRKDETLHQYAARLQAAAGEDPWLRSCAAWYLRYAEIRYSGKQKWTELALPR